MILVVSNEDVDKTLHIIRQTEMGKDASIIARVRQEKGVIMKTHLGGNQVVDMLCGEGLPRIC